eukprot:jgi/Galph1/5159/GphlegSOOS_G3895.1
MAFVTSPIRVTQNKLCRAPQHIGALKFRHCFLVARNRQYVGRHWVMVQENQAVLLNPDNKLVMKTVQEVKVGERASFCRCWKSAKHPFCDGSHNKYNKETGDHVGPIVVAAVDKGNEQS